MYIDTDINKVVGRNQFAVYEGTQRKNAQYVCNVQYAQQKFNSPYIVRHWTLIHVWFKTMVNCYTIVFIVMLITNY